uniref:HECT-type E3 ubiquitin transferase n=1 Tax=Nelumbo nucifera TaxID=4432 RepID=A0A822Y1C6_NELNU|nr:TPA_asm: hypothetical protein HUJ06_027530 [Nelumbo nucifera]
MESRGRKRAELVDQLPADKRACSSSDFKPGSSSSSVQTQMASTNSASEAPDCEMETSSSASVSGRSEGEAEKDSAYGSCDSDGLDDPEQRHRSFREYHPRRSSSDQAKFKRILSSLADDAGPSSQVVALTELCDVLSFCTDDSLSSFTADSFAPILVNLAKNESNPDIMLLAVRAITYLCDVLPRSSGFLVRHDAVPALCARLMAIEYMDLAEQCLQALEKISRDHPLACSQAGAIMAVLNYIDFFSTSVQLVESVAICLIRIVERVGHSSDMLDELCKHGVIHQVSHLVALNSRTTLSQPIYIGLIGLLARLASGSVLAVRTLIELNISSTLKQILATYELSHGMPHPHIGDMHSSQVHEVIKLLNVLLPPLPRNNEDIPLVSDKERILVDQPELLQQFRIDILPVLIQVVNSGANSYVCYGSLSVINKLVYFSRSDMLLDLLKNTNISSFLAGVFARKDHHILISALKIAKTVLEKLPDACFSSFVKEGVVYSIDALLMPERSPEIMFPTSTDIELSSGSNQKLAARDDPRCLCYALDSDQFPSSSEKGNCKLERNSVYTLAKKIKATYFATESHDSKIGMTETLQKLRTICTLLIDKVNIPMNDFTNDQHEECLYGILHQIMIELNGGEPMSTFEFIQSGIVKSLVNYLSCGQHMKEEVDQNVISIKYHFVLKRFEMFSMLSLMSVGGFWKDMPLANLTQKLLSAFSSLEDFPVILNHVSKSRNTYASIPSGHCTMHPCFKVRFVKEEGEACLCNYPGDILTVEPFTSFDAIEGFLWPKISGTTDEHHTSVCQPLVQCKSVLLPLPSDTRSPQGKDLNFVGEINSISSGVPEVQENQGNMSPPIKRAVDMIEGNPTTSHLVHTEPGSRIQDLQYSPEMDSDLKLVDSSNASASTSTSSGKECMEGRKCPTSCGNSDDPTKLVFHLEGRKLDRALTLYQEILNQHVKAENDMIVGPKFWNQVYKITYRKATDLEKCDSQDSCHGSSISSALNKLGTCWKDVPFLSGMLVSKLPCDLEKSNPTYDMLVLLKSLEGLNRSAFHLMSHERRCAFAEGRSNNFDDLRVNVPSLPQSEFVSCKLTEKLEQQMRDPLAVSVGGMPSWCAQLMAACPFLFGFESKCRYFQLKAFGSSRVQPHPWPQSATSNSNTSNDRQQHAVLLPRKKFQVRRSHILDSAAQMMDLYANHKAILEVEYSEEVGTGLGPTMEFYTLVSHEFQKAGLGMWREDHSTPTAGKGLDDNSSGFVAAHLGLFPRPWSPSLSADKTLVSEVIKKFVLLGKIVAKALQDGRVLDLPFSKAFYKLILEKELCIYDIQSFEPEFGRTLLEFQALVDRKKNLNSISEKGTNFISDSCFRDTRIEDLCLEFTLPGYPDYVLGSEPGNKIVNMDNLEEYVSLTVDATVNSGIIRQVEAFKSGFNQVFPIKSLQIFSEEELERLLCGERDAWASNEIVDHVKFDHGYTSSSPPVINLLEIIQEFEHDQRRAFLQFVTGAPRLPPGGLAALNPKLTIVRKHCSEWVDGDLPSVMTCANYLKLPPYSSKERMRERILYAITEGQGSFHLS